MRVAASSMNGFDLATAAGYLQGMMEHRFPLVVGKDFAGTVEALGEGVEGYAVGDAVFGVVTKPFLGTGSLAEYVTVPAATRRGPASPPALMRDAGALGLAGTAALDSVEAVEPGRGRRRPGLRRHRRRRRARRAARRRPRRPRDRHRPPRRATDLVIGLTGGEVDVVDFTGDLAAQVRALAPNGVDAALQLAGDRQQVADLIADGGRLASTLGLTQEAPPDAT